MDNRLSMLSLLVVFCLANGFNAVKVQKPYVNLNDERTIKIVNYAIKKDNRLDVKAVGVKNLQIKGFDDWVAVGIWSRDTYNKTGFDSFYLFFDIELFKQINSEINLFKMGFA